MASALPLLEFQHEQTQPGETILAAITTTGEFSEEISNDQVKFYEGRKEIFLESGIKFYEDTHYLYVYTTREGNFSMKISNILYTEKGELKSTTITTPLLIQTNELTDDNTTYTEILSIKPGVVIANPEAKVKLINKGTSPIDVTYDENEITIQPLHTEEIITYPQKIFSELKISTYKDFTVSIIYPTFNSSLNETPFIEEKFDLKHDPDLLFAELIVDNDTTETIQLFNFGNESITNMVFVTDIDFIEIKTIENMTGKEIHNLSLSFSPNYPGHIQGDINITYTQYDEEKTISIPLSIFVLPKGSTVEDFNVTEETCSDQFGIVCADSEVCDGKAIFTKKQDSIDREYCCLGSCLPIETDEPGSGGWGWLIGLVILIILGAGGFYFYKKSKGIKQKTPDQQIKETTDKYSKRLTGGLERG